MSAISFMASKSITAMSVVRIKMQVGDQIQKWDHEDVDERQQYLAVGRTDGAGDKSVSERHLYHGERQQCLAAGWKDGAGDKSVTKPKDGIMRMLIRGRSAWLQVEKMVLVRPWPKAVRSPKDTLADPPVLRCYYYMGLKKKPAPVYNSQLRVANSVDLNGPVQEFRNQVPRVYGL